MDDGLLPPHRRTPHYSNAVISFFGLFGVSGVMAAHLAGHHADRHADRQRAHLSPIVAVTLFVLAFVVLWFGRHSFWAMGTGLVILDAGMQGMQITNQSSTRCCLTRSRINGAHTVVCFLGASLDSFTLGQLYASDGWIGDCGLGGVIRLALLLPAFWCKSPSSTAA